jgi:membrane protein implicated in regulation of membrane protease activity
VGDVLWWLVIAAVCLAVEFGHRAFIAMFLSIGAVVTAIAAVSGAPVIVQIPVFLAATALSMTALRPTIMRALNKGGPRLVSGIRKHVGHEAVIAERVVGTTQPGRIKLDGEMWKAISLDEKTIEPGTPVLILSLEGTTFVVDDLPTASSLNPFELPEAT